MTEPKIISSVIRNSEEEDGINVFDIECTFSDGQKFAAVRVDGKFPGLAERIVKLLNKPVINTEEDRNEFLRKFHEKLMSGDSQ